MTDGADTFTGFIDSAVLVEAPPHGYSLILEGWVLAQDGRTEELLISLPSGVGIYASLVERPDVASRIPQIPHAKYAGFRVSIPVSSREERYELEFRARLVTGRSISSQLFVNPEQLKNSPQINPENVPLTIARVDLSGTPRKDSSPFGDLNHRVALTATLSTKMMSFLRSRITWSFIPEDTVRISVIIPVCNHAELTFGCLEALRAQMLRGVEVVVVDNASADQTKELLPRMRGVVTVMNQSRLSFSEACNQGAQIASGENLLFLNNDAFILPGALENLLAALDRFPSAGAVGGRLIRPDGKIQEEGAIVLPNGVTVGRGRGTYPGQSRNDAPIRVDFCSAAFLLVRRSSFDMVGGFDTRFSPAYYEDVDLCIRLLHQGAITIFEPTAEAIHIERGSCDSNAAADSYLAQNRRLFSSLHLSLTSLHRIGYPLKPLASSAPRILFIDDEVPISSNGQGQGRCAQLLKSLASHDVEIAFYAAHGKPGVKGKLLPERVTLSSPNPFESEEAFLTRKLDEVDVVFVSRPHHMETLQRSIRSLPGPSSRPFVVYDAEALHAKREILRFEVLNEVSLTDDEVVEVVCNEISLARDADIVLTSSPLESMAFTDFGFPTPLTLSHSVTPISTPSPFENRKNILTVGSLIGAETPNVDGIIWFVTEVLPFIRNLLPKDTPALHSVGTCTESRVTELQGKEFKLLGKIAELTPTYQSHRVFVAPTRFAAGIPIKVIEAAAHGIPCVVTPVIAAQLEWQDECEVLIGYDASDFAAKCAALYVNSELWEEIRNNALSRVTSQFSPDKFNSTVASILERIRQPSPELGIR